MKPGKLINSMQLSYFDEEKNQTFCKLLIAYNNSKIVEIMLNYKGSENF